MKKFYKISLGFGALLASLTTVSAVVACSCSSKKKDTSPKEPDVKEPGTGGPSSSGGTGPGGASGGTSGAGGTGTGGATGGSGGTNPSVGPGQVRPTSPPGGASGAQTGGEIAPVIPPSSGNGNGRPIIDPEIVPTVRSAELNSMYKDIDTLSEKLKAMHVIPGNLDGEMFLEMLKTRGGRLQVINGVLKKLIDPTDENKLTVDETRGFIYIALLENFNEAVLAKNEEKIKVLHSFVGKVGPIVVNGELIKDGVEALSLKEDEDGDLVSSGSNFVKPIYYIATLLKSLPTDFTNEEIKLLFDVLPFFSEYRDVIDKSVVIPELIRSDFLFNFGDLIESLMNKGLGNLDYKLLKSHMISVAKVIDLAVDKTKPSSVSYIANFLAKSHFIEVFGNLVKEGIFGIDERTVSVLKMINSDIIPQIGSKYPEARKNIGLIISLIKIVEKAISPEGLASLTKDEFGMIWDELRERDFVEPLNANQRAALDKFLFDGFASAEDFSGVMKGFIDEDILAVDIPIVLDMDVALDDLFMNLYEGKHTSDWTLLDGLHLFEPAGAKAISAVAQKGLLHTTRDEFIQFGTAMINLVKKTTDVVTWLKQYVTIEYEPEGFVKMIANAPSALSDRWVSILYGMLFRDIRKMSPVVRDALTPTTREIRNNFKQNDADVLVLMLWLFADGVDNLVYEEAKELSNSVEEFVIYYLRSTGRVRTSESERAMKDLVRHIILGREAIETHRPPVEEVGEIYAN